MIHKVLVLSIVLMGLLMYFPTKTITHAATWSGLSPISADNQFVLESFTYDYNPALNKITKTYQYKNITGSTIINPRIVTLFTWSNDICSPSWESMNYNGSAIFSNTAQSATIENQDGLFNWNALISSPTPPLNSSGLFPYLPVQSTQSGVSYPYITICTATAGQWANNEVATFSLSFKNVLNPYWVQSLSWVVSCSGGDCPAYPTLDSDNDGITACFDNCPNDYNPDQLDSYPPGGNGIGDACECEGDFDHDGDVMHGDIPAFKADMGRWSGYRPCTAEDPCKGDFDCDGDVMQGDIPVFKADMGRWSGYKPCPPGSGVICTY